jgi:hypothetical protein
MSGRDQRCLPPAYTSRLLNYPFLFEHIIDKSVYSLCSPPKINLPSAEFWIAAAQVTKPAKSVFYAKLEETLESFGFAAKVRTLCAPAYKTAGRPSRH